MKYALSQDNSKIAYESFGDKEIVLLFAHGWLGSKRWWDNQRDFFKNDYQIVQMDLAGHGDSDKIRNYYSAELYAADILAVAKEFPTKSIILVGHSMSGVFTTMAAEHVPNLKGLVIVDTLKNLDFRYPDEMIAQMMDMYRNNFEFGVKNIIPQYLYASGTPEVVRAKLEIEFLNQKEFAAAAIEDFYKADVRASASLINVPVRSINAEIPQTEKDINSKYYKDYDFVLIPNIGHYPMLEAPKEFNEKLAWALKDFFTKGNL